MTSAPDDTKSSADNWPANAPLDAWSKFAESDAEAGFIISENFRRYEQRDDVFNRAWWDEAVMSDNVVAFYAAHQRPEPRKGAASSLRKSGWGTRRSLSKACFRASIRALARALSSSPPASADTS